MNSTRPRTLLHSLLLILSLFTASNQVLAQDSAAPPLYTQDDMQFLVDMIMHHQQAVDMSALVEGRIDEEDWPEFVYFTEQVARGQRAEIHQMESLLSLAERRGQVLPGRHHTVNSMPGMEAVESMNGMEHDEYLDEEQPLMTGMLSPQQMDALAAASDEEFIYLWLTGMIYHHQGALDMANNQQMHQLDTGRRPYGMDVLVEEIIVVQRAEIHQMEQWLEDWELQAE